MRRQKEIDKFNEILWKAIGDKNLDRVLNIVNHDPRFISSIAEAFVLHAREDLPAAISEDPFEADMNKRGGDDLDKKIGYGPSGYL